MSRSSVSMQSAFVDFVREIFGDRQRIPLHAPLFGELEEQSVVEAIRSSYVSSVGAMVGEFEQEIVRYTGAKFAIATNTGTAALHVGLSAVGVEEDDEVITQSLTFVATCNAIRYCGAYPVFVDIDSDSLSLSPVRLEEFLHDNSEIRDDGCCWNVRTDRRIRACVPMHNLGHPARTAQIRNICSKFNVHVVEDAAESLGSREGDRHTGRVGVLGVLSFNGNKIITTGGGGAVITDNESVAESVRHLTTTAKKEHPWLFLHDRVGFNYRMPNLNAALGCAQIKRLEQHLLKKRELAAAYADWFAEHAEPFFAERPTTRANYWLNAILLPDRVSRDDFLGYTNDCGIMTRPMWTPMHTLPMFADAESGHLDNTESIESRLVCIPSSVPEL